MTRINFIFLIPTAYAYRIDEKEASLPKIPAQVIGYGLAKRLFAMMKNNIEVKSETWKGELENTIYTYGGKLADGKLVISIISQCSIVFSYCHKMFKFIDRLS